MGKMSGAPHVVVFPFPLQGHMTPMLQLASLLHSKGFSVTVLHAEWNAPDSRNHPEFHFQSFADGIDPAGSDGLMGLLNTILAKCREPFGRALERLIGQRDNRRGPVLVSDALFYYCGEIAQEMNIPWLCLRTSSPTSFVYFTAFPSLRNKGYLPRLEGQDLEALIDERQPFRLKDLPLVTPEEFELLYKFVNLVVESMEKASALVFNSITELEQEALDRIRSQVQVPVYFISLLGGFASISAYSFIQRDRTCLSWLNEQAHGSVIYVSIGSMANMDPAELMQVAHGLRDSRRPFLWVVRPGSVQSGNPDGFLSAFEQESKDQGRIVKWAPQTEVLAHPAVGGFMSHCGWNSTLESICAGKPMICKPSFGDQLVNARLISHVWAVGLDMAGKFEREKIKKCIHKLMGEEEEGKEMREKAKRLKELACKSSQIGGTSYEAINRLTDHISSLIAHGSSS